MKWIVEIANNSFEKVAKLKYGVTCLPAQLHSLLHLLFCMAPGSTSITAILIYLE
jgi:hypothetical protein